jgi:hypothetical protein
VRLLEQGLGGACPLTEHVSGERVTHPLHGPERSTVGGLAVSGHDRMIPKLEGQV